MSDDEDVQICDECEEIFLSSKALAEHIKEEHGPPKEKVNGGEKDDAKEEKKKPKMGPASQVRRSRSSSTEKEEKKKPKMGPASQVKRSRSSSTEDVSSKQQEPASKKPKMGPKSKVHRERSGSPMFSSAKSRSVSPEQKKAVSKVVDSLSEKSEDKSKKVDALSEKSEDKSKKVADGNSEKRREEKHEKHKSMKKHKHRDRSRSRERDKSKKDGHRDKNGEHHKSKEKHRDYEIKSKKDDKPREGGDKDKPRDVDKDMVKAWNEEKLRRAGPASKVGRDGDSSDDEETNRRKAAEAKAAHDTARDRAQGKISRTESMDTNSFLASDSDDDTRSGNKSKKPNLKDLVSGSDKKDKGGGGGGGGGGVKTFPSKGTVTAHDNLSGPECPKCGQICKDNSNLKNHILSHYYEVFYKVLPDCKPFACPECGNPSRDRITMVRHYAFTHKKMFELTDVTPDMLHSNCGARGVSTKSTPRKKDGGGEIKQVPKSKIKSSDLLEDSDGSDDDYSKMKDRIAQIGVKTDSNSEKMREKYKEHKEHKHKKEKKHKHNKEHKEHKHKKEKKHKKDKHRDREANPLGSLLNRLTPDSTSGDSLKAKVDGASWSGAPDPSDQLDPVTEHGTGNEPGRRIAHQPKPPRSPSAEKDIKSPEGSSEADQQPHQEDPEDEESDDELGDLPVPVFA